MKIIHGKVWDTIIAESQQSKIKRVAVSYLTDITLLNFNKGDQLIVDASHESIASGKTCAIALRELFKKDVILKSLNNFHGKMFHFGKILIVGSSNVSTNSKSNLLEIIQISDDKDILLDALKVFNELSDMAIEINSDFIDLALTIEVEKTNTNLNTACNECRFVLYTPPNSLKEKKLLRAYFIALIELQTGKINTEKAFRLWKTTPNLQTHIDNGRLECISDGVYKLKTEGVKYFNREKQKALPDYHNSFTKALCSGNQQDLPTELKDKRLKPFNPKIK
ncbi:MULTISPECIES: hypothetical protein [Shewanella]|uniref:hypothetical protein n=1 Tax=Shewanella TaxID=22 RepID=UPI00201A853F|nr:hypothetical protein [Shewanella sp. 10B]